MQRGGRGLREAAAVDPLCRVGHVGPRCYACAPGYGLQGGLCYACPAQTEGERTTAAEAEFRENVGVLFAASALVFAVVGIVTMMNIRAADKGRSAEDESDLTPFLKIVVNYLQVAAAPPRSRSPAKASGKVTHAPLRPC